MTRTGLIFENKLLLSIRKFCTLGDSRYTDYTIPAYSVVQSYIRMIFTWN
jgi:hypothetical protein